METMSEAARFLESAEARLATVLSHGSGDVGQSDTLANAGRHLCLGSGGKRARPMLVRLFGHAVGAPERAGGVAVASEMIHSASLLHDDVVDTGMYRRGRPTVNARWGNIVAVMSGDLILSTRLLRLAELDARLRRARAVRRRGDDPGGHRRGGGPRRPGPARSRGCATSPRARRARCSASAAWPRRRWRATDDAPRASTTFGRHLGVAFQIADDIRDILGTDPGKPRYADIHSRTPSMPILLAAQRDEPLRRKLKDAWAFAAMADGAGRASWARPSWPPARWSSRSAAHGPEIEAALDALGPYADPPGGEELAGLGARWPPASPSRWGAVP